MMKIYRTPNQKSWLRQCVRLLDVSNNVQMKVWYGLRLLRRLNY